MNPHRLVKLSTLSKHSAEGDERSYGPTTLTGAAAIGAGGATAGALSVGGALAGAAAGGDIYTNRLKWRALNAAEARLAADEALDHSYLNRSTTPDAFARDVRRVNLARAADEAAQKAKKTKPRLGMARAGGGLLGLAAGVGTGFAIDRGIRKMVQ